MKQGFSILKHKEKIIRSKLRTKSKTLFSMCIISRLKGPVLIFQSYDTLKNSSFSLKTQSIWHCFCCGTVMWSSKKMVTSYDIGTQQTFLKRETKLNQNEKKRRDYHFVCLLAIYSNRWFLSWKKWVENALFE